MRLQSALRNQITVFSNSAKRFPLALALGITGAVLGTCLAYSDDKATQSLLLTGVLASWLGISLSLTGSLIAEALGLRSFKRYLPEVAALLLALAAYGALRSAVVTDRELPENVSALKFALWMVASHSLVAMTPLLARYDSQRFRLFNIMLFQRALATGALSAVLFLGLVLAVSARTLFGWPENDDSVFGALWFWVAGLFSTGYLVGQIPRWWRDDLPPYPAFVRVLARFILRPLSWVYLIILYAYAARILWLREWPQGTVSTLILAFALLGLLLQLLSEEKPEHASWFSLQGRPFYAVLAPLVVLLFAAIWRRYSEYGLTEARALVWLSAFWLSGIVLYFLLKPRPRQEAIPLTLAIVTFLASVGPWSIFELSLDSQQARLERALEKTGYLRNGKLVPPSPVYRKKFPGTLEAEVSGLLLYFENRDALERLRPWFATAGDSCKACWVLAGPVPGAEAIVEQLGMGWSPHGLSERSGNPSQEGDVFALKDEGSVLEVGGYDRIIPVIFVSQSGPVSARWERGPFRLLLTDAVMRIYDETGLAGEADLNPLLRSLKGLPEGLDKGALPPEALRVDFEGPRARFRLQVKALRFQDDGNRIGHLEAALLIAP
ncbi:MAG: hypothetical protein K0Q91_1958 [Fibrobacteria bacterium]|jgi:hypothetical protein|nr:hypothetical protein [Fibrobacteria bacterium]